MSALAERSKTVGRYNEAERQRALVAVAHASGNTRAASQALADDGLEIPHKTLWEWKNRYAEDYARIRADLLPKIREVQADAHRALVERQMQVSLEGTDLIKQRMPQMEDKDLINAVGKLDIGSGIHTEKAQLLDNQPTHIVKRSSEEILRELDSQGITVETIDADVVSEENA